MREHLPEGNTIIFEAKQRMGKTLGMVMWGYDAWLSGREIHSTIQLGYPHTPLTFEEIRLQDGRGKFEGGHILADELNFFFDCRSSMSKDNREMAKWLLQSKKQGCNLTGTTHDLYSLDLRIRNNYDYLVRPEVFPAYPAKPEVIRLTITNGPQQKRYYKRIVIPCDQYLGLYDTREVYDPTPNANFEVDVKKRRVDLSGK